MNFRRVLTALALVAVFTALASAQTITPTPITCTVSAATAPSVRSEGITEKLGDLLISCPSGPSVLDTTPADRAMISVNFGVPVTSRKDAAEVAAGKGYASEALLLIDEPNTVSAANSAVPGYGQNSTITLCTAAAAYAGGCPAFKQTVNNFYVMSSVAAPATPGAANAYQGVGFTGTSNSKVTFYNVPVIAPGPNAARTYRIANVRVTPGASAPTATLTITASASSATTLSLSNNGVAAATPSTSLTTAVTPVGGVSLCTSALATGGVLTDVNRLAILSFTENFNNAFKTRVVPQANALGASSANGAAQIVASGSYVFGATTITSATSESGLVLTGVPAGGVDIGLADTGTRLKAVFASLPSTTNATIYVSVTNVSDYGTALTVPVAAGNQESAPFATYVGQGAAAETGAPVAPAGTVTINGITAVPVTRGVTGAGEVVWEVVNVDRAAADTLKFAVYVVYSNATNPPTAGTTATVTLGYAATNGDATTTPVGVTTTAVPRFVAPTASAATFYNVLPCQTSLLFPYVTNVAGWETGVAISNTGADPLNTVGSAGTCALSFYGDNAPTAAVSVASLAAGKTYANTLGGMGLVNFQGYMVAVCNFKYAHGFAFINDGKQNMAMGYLSLVMTGTGRGTSLLGEAFQQ